MREDIVFILFSFFYNIKRLIKVIIYKTSNIKKRYIISDTI
jgi:hypothetical protein